MNQSVGVPADFAQRMQYRRHKWRAAFLMVFNRQEQAHDVFREMRARWPKDAYVLASCAHFQATAKQWPAAITLSQELLAVKPDDGQAWFNHGFMLEEAGRFEEALTAFTRSTELSPKLDRAWYGMGLVLIRLQRFEEAIKALKRNTELQPMSPYGWYQMARVHVDLQRPEKALKVIRHLKTFEPKLAEQLERETGLKA